MTGINACDMLRLNFGVRGSPRLIDEVSESRCLAWPKYSHRKFEALSWYLKIHCKETDGGVVP